ncbi:hypothetical protein KHU12_07505 [Pseudocitrobacter faecalis]
MISPPRQPRRTCYSQKTHVLARLEVASRSQLRTLFGMSRAPRFIPGRRVKSKIKLRTLPAMSGKISTLCCARMRAKSKNAGNRIKK